MGHAAPDGRRSKVNAYKLYACEDCSKLFVSPSCPTIRPEPIGGSFDGEIGFRWAVCGLCKVARDEYEREYEKGRSEALSHAADEL
jgi:hypothetical protein